MKSDSSISNLFLKVRCDTSYLCRCTVFLKAVRSFVLYMSSSFYESRGFPDGSGGKSIPVAYIRKYVDVMLVRLIIQN